MIESLIDKQRVQTIEYNTEIIALELLIDGRIMLCTKHGIVHYLLF